MASLHSPNEFTCNPLWNMGLGRQRSKLLAVILIVHTEAVFGSQPGASGPSSRPSVQDTAILMGLDRQIGEAIRESGISREEIFLTTKFWPQFHAPANVPKSLGWTLKESEQEYVDLYLMHWPVGFESHGDLFKVDPSDHKKSEYDPGVQVHEETGLPVLAKFDMVATWRAMESLVDAGKARSIGVSNFSRKQLDELLPHVRIPIAVNQIEAHPWLPNTAVKGALSQTRNSRSSLWTICRSEDNRRNALAKTDPKVVALAKKNEMGVGALLTSWAAQHGTNPAVPKSGTTERIRSNFLELTGASAERGSHC